MAKPIYGGWVTFTAHLCLKYKCELFKIAKRTEKRKREYGYNVQYQNITMDNLLQKDKFVITAVDKHYWEYLHLFPKGTILIIHDPTELKGKQNEIVKLIEHFKIITIRKTVQEFIKKEYNIDTDFLPHPFYEYQKGNEPSDYYSLSISRIDFDKHTDLILEANQFIPDDDKKIQIFGAENRLYVHHKLKDLNFHDYWHGKFPKTLPLSHEGKDLLNDCHFIVDMSIIKGDGGGTQYTFLEAIYHDCALILHKEWIEQGDTFQKDHNCYVVGYTNNVGKEIADIINSPLDDKYESILKNAKELLKDHIQVKWF
ncbi:MAG: hypothetical protein CMG46_00440 [Candidatus Marinimicrobia bacterium]|nr:hypothetical protein [Candidatus Neomarinimicrobiota bacterium]